MDRLFNAVASPYRSCLRGLLEAEENICISDLILTEILQGFKSDKEFETAKSHLQAFPILRLSSPESYIQAAYHYRLCRKHGITIRKTVDCLIAQTAIEHGVALLHRDKDFELISSVSKLQILTPSMV